MRNIIIGRIPLFEDSNDKISFYDYIGAIMPMGFDLNHSIYFNKIDVDRIVYRGYVDELEINFQGDLDKWLSSNNERLQKRQI
ncbi:DUF4176 domain-containing protein [Lactobacillus curvatus]|nr:DUF4176 domain-containing protein [Latilactobacillus curvatus]MSE23114.1 DUF4176 domain-containing protein [Latilactobacillus curvatus]